MHIHERKSKFSLPDIKNVQKMLENLIPFLLDQIGPKTPPTGPGPPKTVPHARNPILLTIGGVPRKTPWPGGPAAQVPPKLQNSLLSDRGPPTPENQPPYGREEAGPGPGGPGGGVPPP